MALNLRIKDDFLPLRKYPKFKFQDDLRYIDLNKASAQIPKKWGYYQYLMLVIFPMVLGDDYLNNSDDSSVIKVLYRNHVRKNKSPNSFDSYLTTNADMYLLTLGSDLELLVENDKIPKNILKRLRSKNDGEMRGVIYEINIAAAFIRTGYNIEWITADGRPEFCATKDINIDVEAKRRDRTNRHDYDLRKELNALKKNLEKAVKKKGNLPLMIFIDTDLPPAESTEYKEIYSKLTGEFKNADLAGLSIVITNSGYEHDAHTTTQFTSVMVIQGDRAVPRSHINTLVLNMYAKLPPTFSENWNP